MSSRSFLLGEDMDVPDIPSYIGLVDCDRRCTPCLSLLDRQRNWAKPRPRAGRAVPVRKRVMLLPKEQVWKTDETLWHDVG